MAFFRSPGLLFPFCLHVLPVVPALFLAAIRLWWPEKPLVSIEKKALTNFK
jgi:hypothetical protein